MPIIPRGKIPGRARMWLASAAVALLVAPAAAAQPLSLQDVLTRAAAEDPTRSAAEARVQAAEAAARQAAVKPFPTLGADIENFAGTGDRQLIDQTESTVFLQQTFERGGKRQARVGAARAEVAVARFRGEVRSLDVLAQVQGLWVEAAAAQALIVVAEERLEVATRLEAETRRRVAAARDPLFAGERARTGVAEARIALDQARQADADARAALAAYVGAPVTDLDLSAFEALDQAPRREAPSRVADLAVLEAERDAALARVRVEESRAVQDPSLRAGVRHFREGGDVAFVVGGSIPLGGRDANRGEIERARAERVAAEAEIAASRLERDREIARLTARRANAAAEVQRIDAEVFPSARRAVALVREGFNRGGGAFTYLEVAEAQRAVTQARARRVELLKSFHADGARLDRLTARHASLLASAETR